MKALYSIFSTLLGVLFLAPAAVAQTPAEVARDYFKRIQDERIETIAELDDTFDAAMEQLEALSEAGATPVVLEQFVEELVQTLDRDSKQGVRAIRRLRARGLADLRDLEASLFLIKRIDGAGTRAAARVEERGLELSLEAEGMLDKLT